MAKQLVTATLRYLHVAPRKVGLVVNALKGLSVNEAEAQLLFRTKRSSDPVLQLLRSAKANATHNFKMDPETLVIKEIRVDQGPMLKRFLPRAMGRATPLHKKMSHVSLTLESKAKPKAHRFLIATKSKAPKKERASAPKTVAGAAVRTAQSGLSPKAEAKQSPKETQVAAPKAKNQSGFMKKIFNRKSV